MKALGSLVLGVLVCASVPLANAIRTAETGEAERLLRSFLPGSTDAEEAAATAALVKLGRKAVPALIRALESPDFHLRLSATLVLEEMGPEAREAVPALIAELKGDREIDNIGSLRVFAARALGAIGPTPESIAALRAVLDEDDDHVANAAVEALAKFGKPAIPALLDGMLMSDSNAYTRASAALAEMGPVAVPSLIKVLPDYNPNWVRAIGATNALSSMKPPPAQAIPALVDALACPISHLRMAAAVALGLMGPASKPAIPALMERLEDPEDKMVRGEAAVALASIGPAAEAAVPALEKALHWPDRYTRDRVQEALRTLRGQP
jgi:HEAT repeat protein